MAKVLVVDYCCEAIFKLPKGLDDLNDKTRVEEYWIRYAILYIRFVDGSFMEIEPQCEPEADWKDGHCNERVADADDWGVSDDEEDEEEEVQPTPTAETIIGAIFDKIKGA